MPSPAVLLLGEMPDETLVLVTTVPANPAGTGSAGTPGAASLFASLRRLHDVGVAHRDLRAGSVFMSGNQDPLRLAANFGANAGVARRLFSEPPWGAG